MAVDAQQPKKAWILQRVATHTTHGAHEDVLADTSEENLDFIWHRWTTFCKEAELDPRGTLEQPSAPLIKAFFDFMNVRGTAQKISNQTYFRRLKQHIKRMSGQSLDGAISKDINAYIRHHLEGQKALAPRERVVASPQDFIDILRFHYSSDTTHYPTERHRVQISFLTQIMTYSALRPSSTTAARKRKSVQTSDKRVVRRKLDTGVAKSEGDSSEKARGHVESAEEVVYKSVKDEPEMRLKYGDFRLFLLNDNGQVRLGLQPQYKHFKGERRREQLKTFTYWTMSYVVVCPAATLLALALHDGALKDVSTLDQLLQLRLPSGVDQIELYWSDEWFGRCIMRESINDTTERELSSAKARYQLGKLGENMGLQQRLVPYCFRRLCLNLLSAKAGADVRRHVAGHTNDQIYENYYVDQRIDHDTANLVLGNPTEERLTAKLHRMTTGADPEMNAPLSKAVLEHIDTLPDIAGLLAEREKICLAIRSISSENGTQSTLREQRKDITGKIRACRQRHYKEYRAAHFRRKNQSIVRAQLSGHTSLCQQSPQPVFLSSLPERLYLGSLQTDPCPWSPQVADNWAQGVRALIDLCGRVESKTSMIETTATCERLQEILLSEDDATSLGPAGSVPDQDEKEVPYVSGPSRCLFCLGDERQAMSSRMKQWKTNTLLWKHVWRKHLRGRKNSETFSCPHPICRKKGITLACKAHFLNHAQTEHTIRLQKTCVMCSCQD